MGDCQSRNGFNQNEAAFTEEKVIFDEPLYKVTPTQLTSIMHHSIELTFLNSVNRSCAGSGVLISKNLVLTAAHNIYDKDNSIMSEDKNDANLRKFQLNKSTFRFYAGEAIGRQHYEVEDWRYSPEYRTCSNMRKLEWDFALIKLKTRIEQNEFMEISVPCLECLHDAQDQLEIFGYPIHKDNYHPEDKWGDAITLAQYGLAKRNRITLFQLEKSKICYAISTLSGHSGAPIVSNQKIIALHNGGGKENENFNVGRLITEDLIHRLQSWGKQLKGDSFQANTKACCHRQLADIETLIPKDVFQLLEKTILEEELQIKGKGLKVINVTAHFNLKNLDLSNNRLQFINLCSNPHLSKLYLYSNLIKVINLTTNTNLTVLQLSTNQLAFIDLSANINLIYLRLSWNQLTVINLASNPNLQYLDLSCNKLAAINLTANMSLNQLSLFSNQLKTINLSANTSLTHLYLFSNQLEVIDLRRHIKLKQLWINENRLKNSTVCWNRQLKQFTYKNQCVALCELLLCCDKGDEQLCRKFVEVKINEQSRQKRKQGKQDNCEYRFRILAAKN